MNIVFHFIYSWWKFNCILPCISNRLISLKLWSRLMNLLLIMFVTLCTLGYFVMQANNNFMIQKLSNNFLVNYPYALIDSFSWKNVAEMNNDGFLLIYICRKRKLTQNISDNAWLTKTKMTALVDYWSYCHSRSSFVLVWLRCFEAFTNIVKYHKPL